MERTYFGVMLAYLLVFPLTFMLTQDLTISLAVKFVIMSFLLFNFRHIFAFKIKFDYYAVIFGIFIAGTWIALDPIFPHLMQAEPIQYGIIDIVFKVFNGVIIAAFVEEFFTRYFLNRWIIDKDWRKVELGKFTTLSFIITVAFFGFSHSRWLTGLIAGALFNLLFYLRKDMNSVVLAHAVSNLLLAAYVVGFGVWQFW